MVKVKRKKHSFKEWAKFIITGVVIATGLGFLVNGNVNLLKNPNQITSVTKVGNMKDTINSMHAFADDNSNGKGNPTTIPDSKLAHPDEYPNWVQFWGPWADEFGGHGAGGAHWGDTCGMANEGCFATALAIQLARGGATKDSKNNEMNPGNNWKDNPHGARGAVGTTTFPTNRGTIKEDPQAGTQAHVTISAGQALSECKKIADAGNYPLIRVNNGGHTVAYWKPGQNAPQFYDPARGYYGTAVKSYTAVGALYGGSLKKFDPNSPGPNGGADTSVGNDSNSDGSGGSDDSSSSNAQEGAAIKPIFNPFRTPSLKSLPADQIGNGGSNAPTASKAELYQIADGFGPTVLTWCRYACYGGIYLFAFITVVGMGAQLVNIWFGGAFDNWIWNHSGGVAGEFFFPGGTILGIEGDTPFEVLKSATLKFLPITVVLLFGVSGVYSRLIAWGLLTVGHLAPHFFN